jgi:L-rhamnose mutarotase
MFYKIFGLEIWTPPEVISKMKPDTIETYLIFQLIKKNANFLFVYVIYNLLKETTLF